MGFQVYDERVLLAFPLTWTGPGGDGPRTLDFTGTNGARIDAIPCVNRDSIDHKFSFKVFWNGDVAFIGDTICPAHSGTDATPVFDLLTAIAPAATGALLLPPNSQLTIYLGEGIVDSIEVFATLFGGTF